MSASNLPAGVNRPEHAAPCGCLWSLGSWDVCDAHRRDPTGAPFVNEKGDTRLTGADQGHRHFSPSGESNTSDEIVELCPVCKHPVSEAHPKYNVWIHGDCYGEYLAGRAERYYGSDTE